MAAKQPSRFKVLRAVDPAVIGGEKALEVSDKNKPKLVYFSNAKGALRSVDQSDVRASAKASAERLLKLNLVKA